MRRVISALSFTSLLALAPGCDSEDTVGDDFRASLDVNVQMTSATQGGSDDGTVIWEIVEADVYQGLQLDGNLLLYIQNNKIYDSNGVETCNVSSPYLNSSLREVIAANGNDVLLTVWGNYVFAGEVDVSKLTLGKLKPLFLSQLMFEYQQSDIFAGEAKDGALLMTTNANLEVQSDGRKLLMAALIAGECGSAGLPGYAF
jgi:hypothetical protein